MVWGLRDKYIPLERLQRPGYTLCWSAKWLGSKEVMFSSIRTGKKAMVKRIHKLLDEADAVVHFNGLRFDIPTLNAEFVQEGMRPPAPYRNIDLYQVVSKTFRFPSNKLDYVLRALKLGQKVKHKGMDLWIGCMSGDAQSWIEMETYNKADVTEMEKLYNHLRPWIRHHPNFATYNPAGELQCRSCGSTHLQKRGMHRTPVNTYQQYRCNDCGTWMRAGFTETTKEQRRAILRAA